MQNESHSLQTIIEIYTDLQQDIKFVKILKKIEDFELTKEETDYLSHIEKTIRNFFSQIIQSPQLHDNFLWEFVFTNYQQQFTKEDQIFYLNCKLILDTKEEFFANNKIKKLPNIVLKEITQICNDFSFSASFENKKK